jgi:hypothetical protein
MVLDEIEREQKQQLFQDYVGQALWHITTIQHLKTNVQNSMPQYIELAHPERIVKGPQTAEEIFNYVLGTG